MNKYRQLTAREMEILSAIEALAHGQSCREVAQNLRISEDTLKHHVSNLYDKLGGRTPPALRGKAGLWRGVRRRIGEMDTYDRVRILIFFSLLATSLVCFMCVVKSW